MGKPETPKDVQEKIVAMYLETGKMVETARACGVSWPTLYRVLYAHGIEKGYGRKKDLERRRAVKVEHEAEVVRLHQSGVSATELTKRFSCSHWVIAKIVKKAGSRPHRRGGKYHVLTVSEIDRAVELYQSGQSQVKVAAIIGCVQGTIGKALAQRGIKARSRKASGPAHGSWGGGRGKTEGGYVIVAISIDDPFASMRNRSGYVLEHRLVLARALGRPLTRHETVHHINGDKTDNRVGNLQLRHGPHGKGVRPVCADCGSHNISTTGLHNEH